MDFRSTIPKKYIKLYDRARSGKSRKAAIKFGCIECMGFVGSEVKNCTADYCSYYTYRPQTDD